MTLVLEDRPDVELARSETTQNKVSQVNWAASEARSSQRLASVSSLVSRAREGDPGAWSELVARFSDMISAVGRRYRLQPADISELHQTTRLRLVENLHRIEQPDRVGGWLVTNARHESLALLRKAARYRLRDDQALANTPDPTSPEPDAGPIAAERAAVVRAAWGRLKPRCQRLLSLLITDDPLGYEDLSQLLQMPGASGRPGRAAWSTCGPLSERKGP